MAEPSEATTLTSNRGPAIFLPASNAIVNADKGDILTISGTVQAGDLSHGCGSTNAVLYYLGQSEHAHLAILNYRVAVSKPKPAEEEKTAAE